MVFLGHEAVFNLRSFPIVAVFQTGSLFARFNHFVRIGDAPVGRGRMSGDGVAMSGLFRQGVSN